MYPESTIIDLLSRMGCTRIKSTGSNIHSSCPFAMWQHKDGIDRNPSFSIGVSGHNKYHCFACGIGGNLLKTLVKKYQAFSGTDLGFNVDSNSIYGRYLRIPSSYEYAPLRVLKHGWYEEKPVVDYKIEDFKEMLKSVPQYLLDRGVTKQQIRKFKLGYDLVRQRAFIPIFDMNNRMVGYSGRAVTQDVQPKYFHAPGMNRKNYVYGENLINRAHDVCYISEGFFDVYAMDRSGLTNCFGILSANPSNEQVTKISDSFKKVVVFPHSDKAGNEMKEKLVAMLQSKNVQVKCVEPIEGKKDVGEWAEKDIRDSVAEINFDERDIGRQVESDW